MTRTFSFILASLLGLALTQGCAKDTGTVPQWPWTEPEPEIPDKPTEPEFPLLPETPHTAFVNPTEAGWTDVTADYPGLRSGIVSPTSSSNARRLPTSPLLMRLLPISAFGASMPPNFKALTMPSRLHPRFMRQVHPLL